MKKLHAEAWWIHLLLGILLCLSTAGPAAIAAGPPLRVTVGPTAAKTGSGDAWVRVTVENVSDHPLHILRWHLPLEEMGREMFLVERDGERLPYLGKLIKRAAPQASDYLALDPGEAIEATVDLATAYDFSSAGVYLVRFRLSPFAIEEIAAGEMKSTAPTTLPAFLSNEYRTEIETPLPPPRRSKAPAFSGCAPNQQAVLQQALAASQSIAQTAYQDLVNAPVGERPSAQRYLEWFGAYTESRYATVLQHFANISDALSNKQITFVCDCNESYYAWVYPSVPYEIHPCQAFWSASLTGTDSQAGTIVHETSHFTVVAGTDDHVYGQPACRSLANSSPDLAVGNADSHEYFAENTPFLPMPQGGGTPPPQPGATSLMPAVQSLLLDGQAASQMSLATALDNQHLQWQTDGDAHWFVDNATSVLGGSSARSGAIGDQQQSTIRTTITGSGVLTFWLKIESEENYDTLSFIVDGFTVMTTSGDQPWRVYTITFSQPGSHQLSWTYKKDCCDSQGKDAVWLDNVQFTASP